MGSIRNIWLFLVFTRFGFDQRRSHNQSDGHFQSCCRGRYCSRCFDRRTVQTSGRADDTVFFDKSTDVGRCFGQPPVISNVSAKFAGVSCSTVQVQSAITDESSLSSVSAKITYTAPNSLQKPAPVTIALTDSGKGIWVGEASATPSAAIAATVVITATDKYGFTETADTKISRTNSC